MAKNCILYICSCVDYIENIRSDAKKKNRDYYTTNDEKHNIFNYIFNQIDKFPSKLDLNWVGCSTGAFNRDGIVTDKDINEMKSHIKKYKGPIWYGFISPTSSTCHKINTPQKGILFLRATLKQFFIENDMNPNNIYMVCGLHSKDKEHIHMHFVFWNKEKERMSRYCKGFPYVYDSYGLNRGAVKRLENRMSDYLDLREELRVESLEDMYFNINKLILVNKRGLVDREEVMSKIREVMDMLPDKASAIFWDSKKVREEVRKGVLDITRSIMLINTEAKEADNETLRKFEEYEKHFYKESDLRYIDKAKKLYKREILTKVLGLVKFIKADQFIGTHSEDINKHMKKIQMKALKQRKYKEQVCVFENFFDNFHREIIDASDRAFNNLNYQLKIKDKVMYGGKVYGRKFKEKENENN